MSKRRVLGREARTIHRRRGYIRSVQRGTFTDPSGSDGSGTITAVDLTRTALEQPGFSSALGVGNFRAWKRVDLQNATTLRSRGATSDGVQLISFGVVERWP